eukprot:1176553-Prorocentrum_minimum.AAC.1
MTGLRLVLLPATGAGRASGAGVGRGGGGLPTGAVRAIAAREGACLCGVVTDNNMRMWQRGRGTSNGCTYIRTHSNVAVRRSSRRVIVTK